ncbi:MAG: ceramidase domain-containing protein [Casimicrobiaceae bacterium]
MGRRARRRGYATAANHVHRSDARLDTNSHRPTSHRGALGIDPSSEAGVATPRRPQRRRRANLAFVTVAVLGLWRVARNSLPLAPVVRFSMYVFFVGLFLTGFGSAYYHWQPDDLTLVSDRLPMIIAFAGMLGALFCERISRRAGTAILVFMLVIGPGSVFYWKETGDLSVYVAVQFGAMAAVILTLLFTEKSRDPFPWWTLIGWYVAAKIFESADAAIWVAAGGVLAGHALKHLAAAIGSLAIANALRARRARSRVD